jgi:myosin heavy subunit
VSEKEPEIRIAKFAEFFSSVCKSAKTAQNNSISNQNLRLIDHIQHLVSALQTLCFNPNLLPSVFSTDISLVPREFPQQQAERLAEICQNLDLEKKTFASVEQMVVKLKDLKVLRAQIGSLNEIEELRNNCLELCSLFEVNCLFEDVLGQKLSEAEKQVCDLAAQINIRTDQISALKQENAELMNSFQKEKRSESVEVLKQEILRLTKENEELQFGLKSLDVEIRKSKEGDSRILSENIEFRAEVSRLQSALEQTKENASKRLCAEKAKFHKIKERVLQLQRENSSVNQKTESTLKGYEEKIQKLMKNLEQAKYAKTQLEDERNKLLTIIRNQQESMQSSAGELEAKVLSFSEDQSHIQQKLSKSNESLQELMNKYTEVAALCEKLRSALIKEKSKRRGLQEKYDLVIDANGVRELRLRLEQMKSLHDTLVGKNEFLISEMSRLELEQNSLAAKMMRGICRDLARAIGEEFLGQGDVEFEIGRLIEKVRVEHSRNVYLDRVRREENSSKASVLSTGSEAFARLAELDREIEQIQRNAVKK